MVDGELELTVSRILRDVLRAEGKDARTFEGEDSLYEDGIGLDSLAAASFSVMLEHELGSDPYAGGGFPRTLQDVLDFYRDRG